MPVQTLKKGNLSYPDGLFIEVSGDKGLSWSDLGACQGTVSYTINGEKLQITTSNAGKTQPNFRDMTLAMAMPEFYVTDYDTWAEVMDGVLNYTAVTGNPVSGALQTVPVGYETDKAIVLDGQNSDGSKPTINSVNQESVAGGGSFTDALTLGTDYDLVKNSYGGWSIVILSSGSGDNTKAFQIDSDYTPQSGQEITAGTTSVTLEGVMFRFTHYIDNTYTDFDFQCLVYNCSVDPSSFVITKNGAEATTLDSMTFALTGDLDTSRTDGDQLFKMFSKVSY